MLTCKSSYIFFIILILLLDRTRASDDMIGLNIRLFNEIDVVVRRLFQHQITITKTSISRAIYFHGYLLEQTLKIFDISQLEIVLPNVNQTTGKELQEILSRQILMLSKIIITKENLYSLNGIDITT